MIKYIFLYRIIQIAFFVSYFCIILFEAEGMDIGRGFLLSLLHSVISEPFLAQNKTA